VGIFAGPWELYAGVWVLSTGRGKLNFVGFHEFKLPKKKNKGYKVVTFSTSCVYTFKNHKACVVLTKKKIPKKFNPFFLCFHLFVLFFFFFLLFSLKPKIYKNKKTTN